MMRLLMLLILFVPLVGVGQTEETSGEIEVPAEKQALPNSPPAGDDEIHSYVDEAAEFPGGMDSLNAFFKAKLKYPPVAYEMQAEGKSHLQFIVSAKGNISNVKVLRGVLNCPECDKEAIRVLKLSSPWLPGKIDGEPVNSVFNLPVVFKLPQN